MAGARRRGAFDGRARAATGAGHVACLAEGMALGTATIEMQSPEEHRERLHEQVKAARAVLVLWSGSSERIAAQRMVLLGADDDTTMYVAGSIDAALAAVLVREPRVMVMVPGDAFAMFDAEAVIARDRFRPGHADADAGRRGEPDHADTVLIVSPFEGSYWTGRERRAYQYRLPKSSGKVDTAAAAIEAAAIDA